MLHRFEGAKLHDICVGSWSRQAIRIEPDRTNACTSRSDDVGRPGIANHDRAGRRRSQPVERELKDRGIRFHDARFFGHDQCVNVRRETAVAELFLLFREQVVRHDADSRPLAERLQQWQRTGNRAARCVVVFAICRGGSARKRLVRLDPRSVEETPEPLYPRVVQRNSTGEHLRVKFLEQSAVRLFQSIERHIHEAVVAAVHGFQGRSRAVLVIEEGVVEV